MTGNKPISISYYRKKSNKDLFRSKNYAVKTLHHLFRVFPLREKT